MCNLINTHTHTHTHSACGHPTAPIARPGLVPVHAHRTEGVTGSEEREGSNGVRSGIGVGGGNGDGNGVGSGTGTGMEQERERSWR